MTVVDGDEDSIPDGIINLYEEFSTITGTTITPNDGMWFDPNFSFALDAVTGDLFLWDLDNASENISDYQFQFLNGASGCPEDVQFLFNVVIGPYSGTAANTADGGVNLQICQEATLTDCEQVFSFDLFQTFVSNPSPHRNGTWSYLGGGDFLVGVNAETGIAQTEIPYTAGPPLVDDQTYNFRYTVPGIAPCDLEQSTDVVVTVVREPFSGFADQVLVCETDLISGGLGVIDLSSNEYLIAEDIEGLWIDASGTGQISNPGDSTIDFGEIYQNLVANNPRFGQQTFNFNYFVESRSLVCNSASSTVSFTVGEFIRPFAQTEEEQVFCVEDESLSTVDLYDYIEFTTENNVLYDYPNDGCTNWEYVSGPAPTDSGSALGLINNALTTNATTGACEASQNYTSRGTIDLSNLTAADAGTYTFRYSVLGSYNGVGDSINYTEGFECEGPQALTNITICPGQSALITITIGAAEYAGEDTVGVEVCESLGTVVLTDLLETDGSQTVYTGPNGVWTDAVSGDVVNNDFALPEITNGSQIFNFLYNTSSVDGCTSNTVSLEFTVFEQFNPGESGSLVVCSDAGEVDLFTLLDGTPDTNGTWSGPNDFTTTDNVALFTPGTSIEGEYIYTVPENGACEAASAAVAVSVGDVLYAGEDTAGVELCSTIGTIDLITLLEDNGTDTIDVNGEWTDSSGASIVNPFVIPTITDLQIFEFIYTTIDVCSDTATLSFTVFEQGDAGIDALFTTCEDAAPIDLFTLLGGSPDVNGTWAGPGDFTTSDNIATFDPSLNVEGDYVYTIPANGVCDGVVATITVSFFESNYAGENTTGVELCDTIIENPIDLITLLATNGTDTIYTGAQGVWTDTATGVVINNPFTVPSIDEQQVFNFTYTTTSDDGCGDTATLSFTVFQSGDAGIGATFETCEDGGGVDLFTLLTGTPEATGTWSGPDGFSTTNNNAPYDPSINDQGEYVYTVPANGACEEVSATIQVVFFATNYAGEDTTGVEVCDVVSTIDLTTLLDDNDVDTIYVGSLGVFTDAVTGAVINNPFVIPVITNQQSFDVIYTTTTENGCGDQATLSFTIFEQGDAGINESFETCQDGDVLNLFDELGGTPDVTGTWSGPEGYTATDNNGTINPMTAASGDYVYTVAANGSCEEVTATVAVTIVPISNAGDDVDTFVCAGENTTSLFNLLSGDAQTTGEFIDLATSQTVIDGIIDVGALGEGTFSYLYVVFTDACGSDDATITFTITPVVAPTVSFDAPFICINDGVTLENLVVSAVNFSWYASAEGGEPLSLSTLLVDNTTYFVSAIDDNGCESPRVPYQAEVLPLSNGECQIQISDGVSDNGDGQNDFLELGTLPDVFPNFDIQIFNRYGTIVYRGNRTTPLFDGGANTGSGLGDQLPTGVYFYIFYPNDSTSEPIDGSFYLSR